MALSWLYGMKRVVANFGVCLNLNAGFIVPINFWRRSADLRQRRQYFSKSDVNCLRWKLSGNAVFTINRKRS